MWLHLHRQRPSPVLPPPPPPPRRTLHTPVWSSPQVQAPQPSSSPSTGYPLATAFRRKEPVKSLRAVCAGNSEIQALRPGSGPVGSCGERDGDGGTKGTRRAGPVCLAKYLLSTALRPAPVPFHLSVVSDIRSKCHFKNNSPIRCEL